MAVMRGVVTRLEAGRPFVEVPDLGVGYAFGPCDVLTAMLLTPGDRVMVASVGDTIEDLAVVSRINPTPAEVVPGGPAGGDLEGTYPAPTLRAGAVTGIGDARYSQLGHLHDDRYPLATKLAQNGSTSTWIRVATVNGGSATQGHAISLLVSGQGSIAGATKAHHIVTFGQRGNDAYGFEARQIGTGSAWAWYVKQISTLVFELWARRVAFDAASTVQVLTATSGATLNLDITQADATGLTALPAARQLDLVDAAAATPSLRTLGTGAAQAAAGDDARLSDQRVPVDLSVTDAKVAAANKDGAAATPSMRTLGTGALQAAAGSHLHDDRYFTETEADARFVPQIEASTIGGGASRRAINLVQYSEAGTSLAGDLVIQTNMPFTNAMTRLHVTGYNYAPVENNIDLELSFYAYSVGPQFINHSALNKGSVEFSNIRFARRVSDGKVAIFLTPRAGSWQYPKLTVDALFGATVPTDAELAGWTVSRLTATTGYDLLTTTTVAVKGATGLTNPAGGSLAAGTHLPNDGIARTTHVKTGVVVIPSYATTMLVSMSVLAHCDFNAQTHWDPQVSTNNGSVSWMGLYGPGGTYHAVHNNAHPGTNLGFAVSSLFDVRAVRGNTIAVAVNGHNDTGSGSWTYVSNLLYSVQFML